MEIKLILPQHVPPDIAPTEAKFRTNSPGDSCQGEAGLSLTEPLLPSLPFTPDLPSGVLESTGWKGLRRARTLIPTTPFFPNSEGGLAGPLGSGESLWVPLKKRGKVLISSLIFILSNL